MQLREREYFRDPFTEDEIRQVIGDRPASDIFSRRSPSFRKLQRDFDSLSDDEMVRLMLEEPRLIKRPIVKWEENLVAGSGKAERAAIAAALKAVG